jgi:hypothetical protein
MSSYTQVFRTARRFLSGHYLAGSHLNDLFAHHREVYKVATLLVRIYYWSTLYLVATYLTFLWTDWLQVTDIPLLWPVSWVEWVGIPTGVHVIATFVLLSSLVAAVYPEKKIFRLLLFVAFVEFSAFNNSFGKINHNLHAWLATAFIFTLLPDGKWPQRESSITGRQLYLTTFWAAQALVFSFYTLSGWWKVYAAIEQFVSGQMIHSFHPYALAYLTASRAWFTSPQNYPPLAPWVIEYPWLGWPLHLSVIYLECFAIVAVFRPPLHKWWGISLSMFHIGSVLILGVPLNENILLFGLLFVFSPFRPLKDDLRIVLRNLPLVGMFFSMLVKTFPKIRVPAHS